jgi:hypothetical protein
MRKQWHATCVPFEDHPNGRCLALVHDQLAVLDVVAERNKAAHPNALLAGRGELVADALANDLALELGKDSRMLSVSLPTEVVVLNDEGRRFANRQFWPSAVLRTPASAW